MSEDESFIVKKHDLAEIVRLQDASALEEFLDQPLTAIAEATTALLPGTLLPAVGRIVQGALKGKIFEQVSREVRQLREKGKIPDDFAAKKYGFKSWVELLTILDEEVPDEDRLEALKAMFYSVNKINVSDGERIASYQMFQIAKRLTSGQLLLLKASKERFDAPNFAALDSAAEWLQHVSQYLGHGLIGLIEQDEMALIEHGLLAKRVHRGAQANFGPAPEKRDVEDQRARLTDLAFKFLENIEVYCTDLADHPKE